MTTFEPVNHTTDERAAPQGHLPVLYEETLNLLEVRPGASYVDATFGGGGHTRGILDASAPDGRVLALDADPDAVRRAGTFQLRYGDRLVVRHANFADLERVAPDAGFSSVHGVLFDLGLSSFQLDEPDRGFSFREDARLDMRFDDAGMGLTAADIVNSWPEDELVRVLFEFGEERHARRIARRIVARRESASIETTGDLAAIVEQAVGGRRGARISPATRTFQALRIAVNDELSALRSGLNGALNLLAAGGRLVVISFHSLEDRIVKQFIQFHARDCICPPDVPVCQCDHRASLRRVTRKPLTPGETEIARNPRSRSAKLRAAERLP
jgi:16S rRNA (cytosine1402-N4)-methyltransferase